MLILYKTVTLLSPMLQFGFTLAGKSEFATLRTNGVISREVVTNKYTKLIAQTVICSHRPSICQSLQLHS